jgi:hypothetical protein
MRWVVTLCLFSLGASRVASAQEIQTLDRDPGSLVVAAPRVVVAARLAAPPGQLESRNLRLHVLDRPSQGFLIGAALGAGAGVLLGSLACHQDVGSRGCTGVALRIGILGLGLGGAFGALIGSAGPASEPRKDHLLDAVSPGFGQEHPHQLVRQAAAPRPLADVHAPEQSPVPQLRALKARRSVWYADASPAMRRRTFQGVACKRWSAMRAPLSSKVAGTSLRAPV